MKKLLPIPAILILILFFTASKAGINIKPQYINIKNSQHLTPPEFPGGRQALDTYVYGNLKWPTKNNVEIEASLTISFFVEKDGRLDGFKVEKSFSPDFDATAVKLLSNSPRWIPAMRDDKPIKSRYLLPIRFHVSIQKDTIN